MGIGIACMVGVVALWSIVPVLVKLLIPIFDPYTIAFLRLAQGAVVVLAVFFARGHSLRNIHLSWWHLLGGLGVGLNYSMFALSLSYTTASAGVLIAQVQYVTLAVLAALVLHESLGPGKIAGMALTLVGIVVIVGMRSDVSHLLAPHYVLGNVLMLFSGLGWGVYALSNKALSHRAGTLSILTPMLTIGVAITGGLAAVRFDLYSTPTSSTLAAALVLGILGTGGAFILVSEGMKRLSAALVGTATAVAPIGQISLAHWVLGEPVTWGLASGGILILVGVLGIVYAERRQSQLNIDNGPGGNQAVLRQPRETHKR
jgi:drug/metabolite transporter (DMT)-like permease